MAYTQIVFLLWCQRRITLWAPCPPTRDTMVLPSRSDSGSWVPAVILAVVSWFMYKELERRTKEQRELEDKRSKIAEELTRCARSKVGRLQTQSFVPLYLFMCCICIFTCGSDWLTVRRLQSPECRRCLDFRFWKESCRRKLYNGRRAWKQHRGTDA